MEDANAKMPLFKRIDRAMFERIDKFRQSPNYNALQDVYNGFEEEQQKLVKALTLLALALIPFLFLGFLWWGNDTLRADLEMRISLVNKANEIIGQTRSLSEVAPQVLSARPIDSESMLTSRLSNLLSSMGIDLSKIQVKDFSTESISSTVAKSEANLTFSNFSTDDLMNLLTSMIQGERFRIQELEVKRNAETNLLQGTFHAIHYASVTEAASEEE